LRYGDTVVLDGAEIELDSKIDGQEVGLSSTLDGGEAGAFYNTGASDYELLAHKPHINGVELIGDKSIEALGVETLTNMEIKSIFDNVFKGGI